MAKTAVWCGQKLCRVGKKYLGISFVAVVAYPPVSDEIFKLVDSQKEEYTMQCITVVS